MTKFEELANRAASGSIDVVPHVAKQEFTQACMKLHLRGRLDIDGLLTADDATFRRTVGIIFGYCEVIDATPACDYLTA